MQFLKLSQVHNQYAQGIENMLVQCEDKSYDNLRNVVYAQLLDNANFYELNLNELQLCNATDTITNLPSLRLAWYEQIGIKPKNSINEFALDLIEHYKPQIIYDHFQIFKGGILEIKDKFPFVKIVLTWDCYAASPADGSLGYDLYLTCLQSMQQKYEAHGQACYYNPFGFEKRILENIETNNDRVNKVAFSGSIISDLHNERLQTVNLLRKQNHLHWWIGNMGQGIFTKSKLRELTYGNFSAIWRSFLLEKNNRGKLYGKAMYELFAQYQICLNVHGNGVPNIGNMRLTEASGMAACQIIDWKPNATDYFEPDTEAVFYKSLPELADKVNYLINNPNIAREIGQAGQARTLRQHTMEQHVQRMWESIQNHL